MVCLLVVPVDVHDLDVDAVQELRVELDGVAGGEKHLIGDRKKGEEWQDRVRYQNN